MSTRTLGIFVKHPVPGEVKTRLATMLGAERAAAAYAAFIADIVDRHRRTADRRVLGFAPGNIEARNSFRELAGDDYELWPQPELPLGERMARFFREQLADRGGAGGSVVLIGSDSPTLPREFVERAFEELRTRNCVLGPATDGGYYLVGQSGRFLPIFDGIAWSTAQVLDQTISRLEAQGVRPALLPPWYDVDTPEDWQMLCGHVRAGRCAGLPLELPHTERLPGWDIASGPSPV